MRPSLPVWFLFTLPWATPALAAPAADAARQFDTVIAPILSRRCLECHDTANREGKLDLSRKSAAFTGGKSGPAIVPGSAAKSRIWKSVAHDEMPEDRPSLSPTEKEQLRKWIDSGAVWPGEEIDPLAHLRGGDGLALPRRLTRDEYVATVRAATGVLIEREAEQLLPAEARAEGFRNTAYHLTVDLVHIQAYAELARVVAGRLDPAPFLAGTNGAEDKDLETLVTQAGSRLLRGPLDPKERTAYLALAREGAGSARDGNAAARLVVEAMLQAPRFLYRIEAQRGDGTPRAATPHELASRLSYLIWGSPPDETLFRAAESGELATEAGLSRQADRLLADPRAVEQSLRFARDWLDLDRLDSLAPDPKQFPNWSSALAADFKRETLAYFRGVVWEEKLPLVRLFNAPFTYASPRLASHYGFAPGSSDQAGPEPLLRYRFAAGKGDRVANQGRLGSDYDLTANKAEAIRWRPDGGLELKSPTALGPKQPAKELTAAIRATREFTVSMRVIPANTKQEGPARILTLSQGTSERNLTLGQEGDRYEIRLRGKGTGGNGTTGWQTGAKAAKTQPVHLLLVRQASGNTRLFLDGQEAASREIGGDLDDWKDSYRLVLGNETTGDRPWLGTYLEVAVYDRALLPDGLPAERPEWARVDLAQVPGRGGLLTQGSLLTVGGGEASMVARGLFVLREILGSGVTNAPSGTDTTPIPPQAGQSRRAVSEARVSQNDCAGCHAKFEPLAYGLEKFDGLGAWQDRDEHGNAQREDGRILFPGESRPVAYGSVSELMDLLAESERVSRTITRKATQFAIGRPLGNADAAVLDAIHRRATAGGGTWPALLKSIALSELIRSTPTEPKS